MEVVSLERILNEKYYEIQRNFMSASSKINLKFDHDVFGDTYLKCCTALSGKVMTEESIISYFWAAFANNSRKKFRKSKYIPQMSDLNENSDVIDEVYNDTKYNIYDIINESVLNKYGDKTFIIWKLHFIDNKTYEELEEMGYTNINFHNLFRQITNYIKNRLPKENEIYKSLVKEAF